MKRKAIEAIPPLPAEQAQDKKKFVAAVEQKEIKGEPTLIIDIFRNLKKGMKQELVRLCFTKDTWGSWYPEKGYWTEANIMNTEVSDEHSLTQNNISITEKQEVEIKRFLHAKSRSWWDAVLNFQTETRQNRRRKTQERKWAKLEERIRNMPEIPAEFYEWCEESLFRHSRYIFYRRKGRYAEFHCACCGAEYKYQTQAMDTYEGQFEHLAAVPRQGQKGRCEVCDTEVEYKAIGRRDHIEEKKSCYMIQPYGTDGGAVIRYFDIYKTSQAGSVPVYEDVEISRSFFLPDQKKIQKDYQVYDRFIGTQYWMPNNLPGLATISVKPAPLYPGSGLKGTMLEYSAVMEYAKDHDQFHVLDYMELYRNFPQLELIIKMEMTRLAERLLGHPWNVQHMVNTNGRNAAEVLEIDKGKIRKLVWEKGSETIHTVLKVEHALGLDLKEEEEDELAMLDIQETDLKNMFRCMSARQIINRVYKYSGLEQQPGLCGKAIGVLRAKAQMYADYITMRMANGYDMTNQIYVYPRNLREEHDKMVLESNAKEADRRLEEVRIKYPGIRSRYRELVRTYSYRDGTFNIRPAKSAEEIVMEGRILHHCVGGNSYLDSHEKGRSTILFLRHAGAETMPYVTVEVRGFQIIQWYGKYDKKPEQKQIDRWLEQYLDLARRGLLDQKEDIMQASRQAG